MSCSCVLHIGTSVPLAMPVLNKYKIHVSDNDPIRIDITDEHWMALYLDSSLNTVPGPTADNIELKDYPVRNVFVK